MKRSPAFDPPEYVDWTPDAALVESYPKAWERDPERAGEIARMSREQELDLYRGMLRTRLHDIMLKRFITAGTEDSQIDGSAFRPAHPRHCIIQVAAIDKIHESTGNPPEHIALL